MKKHSTSNAVLVFIVLFQFLITFLVDQFQVSMSIPIALTVSQMTILLPFVFYCMIFRENALEMIRFKKIRLVSILFSVMVAVISYPVVMFLNAVSMLFVDNAMTDVMPAVLDMGLLPGLFFMAFMPAIVEETIFRGMLYNTYSKTRPIAGMILSAVLFGLMHMNFNQMPYAIYLGIIMALMMEACDSIIAPMVVHFTMNATSSILVFVSEGLLEMTGEMQTVDTKEMLAESMGFILALGIFAVFALVIVAVLIFAAASINGRPLKEAMKKKEVEKKVRLFDIWIVLFVIYTVYECIVNLI